MKDCTSCNFKSLAYKEDPCKSCHQSTGDFKNWEPIVITPVVVESKNYTVEIIGSALLMLSIVLVGTDFSVLWIFLAAVGVAMINKDIIKSSKSLDVG